MGSSCKQDVTRGGRLPEPARDLDRLAHGDRSARRPLAGHHLAAADPGSRLESDPPLGA
jgi:hypothetical protein